jgi:hypothetical protein
MNPRERKLLEDENYVMRSFIIFTLHIILLGRLIKAGEMDRTWGR